MPIRYNDLDKQTSGVQDFVLRKRTPTIAQLAALFIGALVVGVCVAITVTEPLALIAIIVIMLGAVGWYAIVQIQRNRDLVLTTEFQNALFASALGINNKFCLIIKRDGNIIYLDRAFQDMFPGFVNTSRRTIDVLLDHAKVSQEDSAKIFTAVERGIYDKVVFNVRDANGLFHRIIMSIEPILRPSGFILLRGREYIEHRSDGVLADAGSAVPVNKPTITLFSHVIDNMNMGVYMASPAGHIIYASPLLEEWLGFKDGEIVASNLLLQDIVYTGAHRSAAIEPVNYEGNATLQKKDGGMIKVFINQKTISDEQGKVLGCTAIVHNVGDAAIDVKKKLW